MVIASRTPEGVPGRCPLCGSPVCVDPSLPTGDAPCPVCGQLLWFVNLASQARLYPLDQIKPEAREKLAAFLEAFGERPPGDSLDLVEFVMEIEESLGITIADEEAERLRSIEDLIDILMRKLQAGA